MSRFLKLTKTIINTKFIQHIDINNDRFIIHLMTNNMDGIFIFAGGSFQSYNTEIKVCKTKHLNDYKTVSDWIDNELK